jgi:hypothetical protein
MLLPARSRGRVVGTLLCERRLGAIAGTFDPGFTKKLEMSTAASAAALYRYDWSLRFGAPPASAAFPVFPLLDMDEQQKAIYAFLVQLVSSQERFWEIHVCTEID